MSKPFMWVCMVPGSENEEQRIRCWTMDEQRAAKFAEQGLEMLDLYLPVTATDNTSPAAASAWRWRWRRALKSDWNYDQSKEWLETRRNDPAVEFQFLYTNDVAATAGDPSGRSELAKDIAAERERLAGRITPSVWRLMDRAIALLNEPQTAWQCAARKQGTAGGNAPADCDWPGCGCDPAANKVLEAIDEAGFEITKKPMPLPWDHPAVRSYEPVEALAAEIYDGFVYNGPIGTTKPKWLSGGNGTKQDEARSEARLRLHEAGHSPAVSRPDHTLPRLSGPERGGVLPETPVNIPMPPVKPTKGPRPSGPEHGNALPITLLETWATAQAEARASLREVVDLYCALIKSGDAGSWNPEDEEPIKRARAILDTE